MEFDPQRDKSTFFGRVLSDEKNLREQVKAEKERQLRAWNAGARGPNVRRPSDQEEDEFDRLVREQQKESLNEVLAAKVAELANDLEQNERNYSDIDMIYAKKQQEKKRAQE